MSSSTASTKQSRLATLQNMNVLTAEEVSYLTTLDISFPTTVNGVFQAINALAKLAASHGESGEESFHLMDREGSLLKYHQNRPMDAWASRKVSLRGSVFEYASKKVFNDHLLQLTPECVCMESPLKSAEKKHAFLLVTPYRALNFGCSSFAEKLIWVGALSRAILVPRRKIIGSSLTQLYRGTLSDQAIPSNPELEEKVMSGAVVGCENVKHSSSEKRSPSKFHMVLQGQVLMMCKNEAAYSAGRRPVKFIFLEHSTNVIMRDENTVELVILSVKNMPTNYFEFEDSTIAKKWFEMMLTSLGCARKKLRMYYQFYNASVRKPVVIAAAAPVVPSNTIATPPKPALNTIKEEETDPRPRIQLRLIRTDDSGKIKDPESKEPFAYLHIDLGDALVNARDEIYSQLNPDVIPTRFTFLRLPSALHSEIAPWSENVPVSVATSQEDDFSVQSCLVENDVLLLTCPDHLILRSDNWEAERIAYRQEIMHLEAQLAEARRALHDKAMALKRSGEKAMNTSQLFSALSALQRDQYLSDSIKLDQLEYDYLCVFNEDDALRAFASSPSCILRSVWRKLCADPKKMRKYIEDLERFVLRPYKIRKERLATPYWTMQVLRDVQFTEDSSRFEAWAKTEPWVSDDSERYIYLTSKLLNVKETGSEFTILLHPVPTSPPSKERDAGAKISPAAEAKLNRPKAVMNGDDAAEAIKQLKMRQSAALISRNLNSSLKTSLSSEVEEKAEVAPITKTDTKRAYEEPPADKAAPALPEKISNAEAVTTSEDKEEVKAESTEVVESKEMVETKDTVAEAEKVAPVKEEVQVAAVAEEESKAIPVETAQPQESVRQSAEDML